MRAEGFIPDFPPQVLAEVNSLKTGVAASSAPNVRDLRALLWSSIDNTESRDLDQVEWAEKLPDGKIRVLVGIADVDSVVKQNSATDLHANANGTSVYTGGPVFPMLPEKLSTDLTSLRADADRLAIVIEFVIGNGGEVANENVFGAILRNQAKLGYERVAQWLEGKAKNPSDTFMVAGLEAQLRLQQEASERLARFRREHGALALGGVESVPVIVDNQVTQFAMLERNPARDIIEGFMVTANVAMARFLRGKNSPALRRVVRTPKRWDRIQALAEQCGETLPAEPDSRALSEFLARRKKSDPTRFPELSLSVLKSLGPGEYVVEHPGTEHEGHFGLAVNDYTHSTAPNRRYADLLTQRLLKSVIGGTNITFTEADLTTLAAHCTEREAAARTVERFLKKVAAAAMLSSRIGEVFEGIVTGVTPKGTFARLLTVPAEGRIMSGEKNLDIGYKVQVRLIGVDMDKGFIDFKVVT